MMRILFRMNRKLGKYLYYVALVIFSSCSLQGENSSGDETEVVMNTHPNGTPRVVVFFEEVNGRETKSRKVIYSATGKVVKEIDYRKSGQSNEGDEPSE